VDSLLVAANAAEAAGEPYVLRPLLLGVAPPPCCPVCYSRQHTSAAECPLEVLLAARPAAGGPARRRPLMADAFVVEPTAGGQGLPAQEEEGQAREEEGQGRVQPGPGPGEAGQEAEAMVAAPAWLHQLQPETRRLMAALLQAAGVQELPAARGKKRRKRGREGEGEGEEGQQEERQAARVVPPEAHLALALLLEETVKASLAGLGRGR
jgi:hypothetical protein